MVSSKSFPSAFQLMALSLMLIGIYGSGGRSFACTEEERAGLMNLKAALNLPNGSALPSWRNDRNGDCCGWERVTCSSISMRVTELQLEWIASGDLVLNASLFLPFQELESVDLSENRITAFTGTLRLKNLRVLRLHSKGLIQVPSFDKLPSLKEVYLRGNSLKNISHLEGSKLEVLDVSGTNLDAQSLSIIWNVTSLETLSISDNQLNISIFPGLCQLLRLEEFNAADNDLVGSIPPCLQNLTSLHQIDLTNNHFVGNIPSSVFHSLWSLQNVLLSGNAFNDSFSLAAFNNNSRLEVFELINNYNPLSIMTENPLYSPSAQLKVFSLSHCTINEPHGVIPTFLKGQHDLRFLELSHSNMGGDFPSWLFENNTKLEVLMLTNNAFSGSFALNSSLSKNIDMKWIDISSNYMDGKLPDSIGTFFPNLFFVNMSNNHMQGVIPSSLGDMKSLYALDLSSNYFTGEIPQLLLNGCEYLGYLMLSKNKLHGSILPRIANLTRLGSLYLDDNQFTGEICPGLLKSSSLQILDANNNFLSGAIPSWIGDFAGLEYLSLSNNSLEGSLPLSLCKLHLELLDLSFNNFGPVIPSCVNVSMLRYLSLENDYLAGPFPVFLSRASSMILLNLRNNGLSGRLPPWIGSLSGLRALLLKGNSFSGTITHHLCQLKSISIMDLSYNKLSGTIPSCLSNLSFGNPTEVRTLISPGFIYWVSLERAESFTNYTTSYHFSYSVRSYMKNQTVEVKFTSKSRYESYWGNILELMSGLDLSCNNLSGSIPLEIGYLIDLHTLNLSHNYLTGPIPSTFSELKEMESLDLSYNRLSGGIPQQLLELYRLSAFSVAHNNLSGRTPEMKSQFATFGKKSYEGNPFLCGPPLESCNSQPLPMPPYPDEEEEDHSLSDAFKWSFIGSYVVTLLVSVAFFFLNSYYSTLILNFCCRHILSMYYRLIACV